MDTAKSPNRWLVFSTFTIALLLTVYPLPLEIAWLRPQFIPLVFIYWAMTFPHVMGIGAAWLLGFLTDLITHSILGQHALAMVVVAYICALGYQRIRTYEPWQQALWVFVIVGIYQLFVNWVHNLTGHSAVPSDFLLPAFASALLWPVAYTLLERLRLYYRHR
ncbi:rod shape-determining protein MreD [Marinibactrum halimedae]|uniref:Rod shape-determining protein MreD n=1 Tax=Marinibactrum halimedae TaxID=1444977 RepID=A0AA37T829_9GAMM|nr:rod shape-determining protein MreD [Marinibactrum halimedae]MCD9458082.1 rod shape-determining protein MreD [Marinibactrum halimedae]GLS25015.1 rod shape-determining protein MreD [Marinibactrum halimedae]